MIERLDIHTSFYGRKIWHINLNTFDYKEQYLKQIRENKISRAVIYCPTEILKCKKELNAFLDGLNLAKIRTILAVDGLNYYQYLKPNRVMFSVHPIYKEDEYRKKNYRNIILTRYIMEAPYVELNFDVWTLKDYERIYNVVNNLPMKTKDKLAKEQIPIVVNDYCLGQISLKEWDRYNAILINHEH